jgi:3-hydroxyacyl-CoA dehydrogenase
MTDFEGHALSRSQRCARCVRASVRLTATPPHPSVAVNVQNGVLHCGIACQRPARRFEACYKNENPREAPWTIRQLRRDGNVAIITIDNPPVNALRHGVRKGIMDSVIAARDDASVEAIILTGAGRTFVAGADITEFGKPSQPPSLIDVIATLDEVKKPTIAAVHGTPLGGGARTDDGMSFPRRAAGTRLGLPEIKLGMIPGAGGTQRLPRLVGIEKALPMILSGDPIPGEGRARGRAWWTRSIEGDLVAGAVKFAAQCARREAPGCNA